MAYTQDEIETKFRYILELIEEGNSLRSALLKEGMPDSHTFYKWVDNDEQKLLQYTRATELRADYIFEDIIDIADDEKNDVHRARLRVDSRKWAVSKMNPKKYGDKMQQDINIKTEQPLFGDG